MPVTYTNRKGTLYYLCRVAGKTGRLRYTFAREPRGEPVEQLPEGFKIVESIDGIVTLARDRPSKIRPEEVAAVEAALRQNPRTGRYRVVDKLDRIEVYEAAGMEIGEALKIMGLRVSEAPAAFARLQAEMDKHARYSPVLRFLLAEEASRTFEAERWCYLGGIDDWISIGPLGPLDELIQQIIPKLGTDAFYELY